jgi:hypothetical protein
MRTVTINGSVRFALQTVSLKNGTVTVAIAVKNCTVKKTENGTVRTRYGHGTVRYGTVTVTSSDPLLYVSRGGTLILGHVPNKTL